MDPIKTEIAVLGAGPGGYAAAFYAADKGKQVVLIEQEKRLGGVCLNRGCIPSKALLHATHLIGAARESAHRGIAFGEPKIELEKLRAWKDNPRIMTSREALEVEEIPDKLLVVGGGYIGMELGTVYAALGSKVVVVEALDSILAGADPDLVRPVMRYAEKAFQAVRLKAKVAKMATAGKAIKVSIDDGGAVKDELYDRVLVSVGRVANIADLGLENTKIEQDDKGFIKVNPRQQTADPAIYAIGDIAGGVLLAHKASKEARIAVEVITGEASAFDQIVIPAVVFTDPEVAWCGLTENEAKAKGLAVEVARFPWAASGRALTFDRTDGLTKLIIDPGTERILGVGIVGHGAGELVAEGVLAVEMGATARDLAECVHPHPTLSETLMEAAEVFFGHATHTFVRKKAGPA